MHTAGRNEEHRDEELTQKTVFNTNPNGARQGRTRLWRSWLGWELRRPWRCSLLGLDVESGALSGVTQEPLPSRQHENPNRQDWINLKLFLWTSDLTLVRGWCLHWTLGQGLAGGLDFRTVEGLDIGTAGGLEGATASRLERAKNVFNTKPNGARQGRADTQEHRE